MSLSPASKFVANDGKDGGGMVASTLPRGCGIPMCNLTTVSVVNADSFAIDGEVLHFFEIENLICFEFEFHLV